MTKWLPILFRDRHDVWSFLNVAGRFFFRLITVGLLIKVLSKNDMAVWYVFLAIFGVSAILEGGLKLVVTRQIACKSNYALGAFSQAVYRVYGGIVLMVCLLAWLAGPVWMVYGTSLEITDQTKTLWFVFVLANGVGLLAGIQAGMISGIGEVATAQKNELIGQAVNAVFFLILWWTGVGEGLSLPVLAMLCSSIIVWYFNHAALKKMIPRTALHKPWKYLVLVTSALFKDSSKMIVSIFSFHLLTSVFMLLIAAYQPVEVLAAYGLSMQVLTLVLGISGIWVAASFPRMAKARGNQERLRVEFLSALKRTMPVLLLGMMTAVWLAPIVVEFIRGENVLLAAPLLGALALILFLENTFAIAANLLQSQGKFSVVAAFSVLFAVLVLIATLGSLAWLGMGLMGVLFARLVVGMFSYDMPLAWHCYRLLKG